MTSCANSWSFAITENVGKHSDIKSHPCSPEVNISFYHDVAAGRLAVADGPPAAPVAFVHLYVLSRR